jgi:glycosyltransferase involved in cell wall biosynthesis
VTSSASTLLLVTHVALKTGPQGLLIDDQTASGLAQWSRHFDKVTYYGIDAGARNSSSATWVDLRDHSQTKACELVALPRAYEPLSMLKHYGSVRRDLKAAISNHRHLSFTFGGLFGDWPAVAAREAIRQNRRYGAWIDRVEPLVVRNKIEGASFGRKLMWRCLLPAITHNVNHLVRNSGVALLQGMDTFEHYAKLSADPHCTYDTHTLVSDEITLQELAVKTAGISAGAPIKILYVGRAAAMKGPGDWLSTLEILRDRNVPFQATWIGDGSQLPAMKMRIAEKELSAHVDLPGFEGDREVLLRRMKESDIFLFCHKTPESPRCLIEALVSGCPLVGYDTAYSRGLVAAQGGASLVPQDDVMALADRITTLNQDRASLCALITAAAATGKLYNEDIVYERRAELMMRA